MKGSKIILNYYIYYGYSYNGVCGTCGKVSNFGKSSFDMNFLVENF